MKKLLAAMLLVTSVNTMAALATYAHLGCQLETGNSGVFHELRKFNISPVQYNYKRVLIAFDGTFGECYLVEHTDVLKCDYINNNDQQIEIFLNKYGKDTIDGEVYYDGFLDKTHNVNCSIHTSNFEWE